MWKPRGSAALGSRQGPGGDKRWNPREGHTGSSGCIALPSRMQPAQVMLLSQGNKGPTSLPRLEPGGAAGDAAMQPTQPPGAQMGAGGQDAGFANGSQPPGSPSAGLLCGGEGALWAPPRPSASLRCCNQREEGAAGKVKATVGTPPQHTLSPVMVSSL